MSTYSEGSYFALLFDMNGEKHGIMYGTDIDSLRDALHEVQEDIDVDYVILEVVENPKNKKLH